MWPDDSVEQDGDALVRRALQSVRRGRSSPRDSSAKGVAGAPVRGGVMQLKVSLKGAKPPIWRRLQMREDVTLDELHGIIQAAFMWYGGHLHVFEGGGREYADPDDGVEHTS